MGQACHFNAERMFWVPWKIFIYLILVGAERWIMHLNVLHVLFLSLACSLSYLQNTYEYRQNVCDVIYLCCFFQLFICLFIHGRTNWNWKIHFCWRALGPTLSPPYTKGKDGGGGTSGLLVIALCGVSLDSPGDVIFIQADGSAKIERLTGRKTGEWKLKGGKSMRETGGWA